MSMPMFVVEIIKKLFPFRYSIAKATRFRPVGKAMDKMLFENDDCTYLPRDNVIKVSGELEEPEQVVLPSQVVEHFINNTEYIWIMDKCICRDASSCKNYPIDMGCVFLGKPAMDINPRLGRKASREEALKHVRKARETGLVHMIGRNKLDSAWLNVWPSGKLMTICNCCPCCCLWGILPKMDPEIARKIHKMPGVHVTVTDKCAGCGTCEEVCFVGAIRVVGDRAVISDACRGCGRCADACPEGAIEVEVEGYRNISEIMERLERIVDIS